MMLDRECWGPSSPGMTLEVMALLSIWPGVEDPGFCLVKGRKSDLGRMESQTRTKGRKEERNSFSLSLPP